jgi:tRNA dimethylallyltransferase
VSHRGDIVGAEDALSKHEFHCLIGPTAVGKSRVALAIAERSGAEIVSLDSMQVYRGMDIGTAKPSSLERARVPHHMLDLVEPDERFDVQRYLTLLRPLLADAALRGRRLLFTGGTGFYLQALLAGLFEGPPIDVELRRSLEERCRAEGNSVLHAELASFDPRSSARIHMHDTKRLVRAHEVYRQTGRTLSSWQREWWGTGEASSRPATRRASRIVGLHLSVIELDRRIAERTRAMLAAGWPEEAASVRARTGFGPSAAQALGYREALALADGEMPFETCAQAIALRTRQFARRQRTWYRKLADAVWFPAPDDEDSLAAVAGRACEVLGWSARDERAALEDDGR